MSTATSPGGSPTISSEQGAAARCPSDGQPAAPCATVNDFAIFRCTSCGLRFVPPDIVAKVNYDELYREGGDYDHHMTESAVLATTAQTSFPKSRQRILDSLRARPPKTALEIGCGVGSFTYALEQLGVECWATDMSSSAVERARQYVKAEIEVTHFGPEVFPGRRFESAFMWEVLEHIADPRPLVSEIHRRLEPGGRFYLSTPNYESRLMWADIARDPRAIPPVHVTFWTRESLRKLLSGVGFARVDVQTTSFPSGAARRIGGRLRTLSAAVEAQLRPSQRRTLVAIATK